MFTSWILLILIKTYLIYVNYDNQLLIDLLHKTSILFGIISIWILYDKFSKNRDISQTRIYALF